jgi:hypothetical protein
MIQSDLFAALATTFSNRLYPSVAPQNTARPYGVYSRVSQQAATIHGTNGAKETQIQLDVYADTYGAAVNLADLAAAAIRSAGFASVQTNAVDEYETDTKLHRVILEFTFWAS